MKSRFKIGILLTIGITLLAGLILTTPVSADRVTTATDSSQSTKIVTPSYDSHADSSSANAADKSSSTDTDTKNSKVNQNSTSAGQTTTNNTNSTAATTDSTNSSSTTPSNNDKQATATVAVSVANNQQSTDQTTTPQNNNVAKAKGTKKITLTTPNSAKRITAQNLNQKIALIPQVSKKALAMTGGVASLVWVPTIVVIFNTLV